MSSDQKNEKGIGLFSDRSLAPMEDLREELARVAPGSAEERAILERARERRDGSTDEISVTRAANLLAAAGDERHIVPRGPAQQAAHVAIERVTEEHQIPVTHSNIPHTLR